MEINKPPFMMNLSSRVKKIRELSGYKQEAIARDMEITQQAYSCFEGQNLPRMETINRFCKVLKVSHSFLFSDIEITDETIRQYGNLSLNYIIQENRKLNTFAEIVRRKVNS